MQSSHDDVLRKVFLDVAMGRATSRAALAGRLGTARSTAGKHVDVLVRRGLLTESGPSTSTGGRPGRALRPTRNAGLVLAVDVRPDRTDVGLLDPGLNVVSRWRTDTVQLHHQASAVHSWALDEVTRLERGPLLAAGLSVPAPVTTTTGAVNALSIVEPAWDGTRLVHSLMAPLRVPHAIGNDATLRAEYEATSRPEELPLLYVHLSQGVGIGIVGADGKAWSGADGLAGDMAHRRRGVTDGRGGPDCSCGRTDCAAVDLTLTALLAAAQASGVDDLAQRVRGQDTEAVEAVRHYAACAGQVVGAAVDLLNPRTVLLGGDLVRVGDVLLSAFRGAVYDASLPLVTRRLAISPVEQSGSDLLPAAMAALASMPVTGGGRRPRPAIRNVTPPEKPRDTSGEDAERNPNRPLPGSSTPTR